MVKAGRAASVGSQDLLVTHTYREATKATTFAHA
jgi:hypothetical protein